MDISVFVILEALFIEKSNTASIFKNCTELLSYTYQEGEGILGTVFEFAHPNTCFICTKKNINNESVSEVSIPLYNNLVEIGLNMKYIPHKSIIGLVFSFDCYLQITFELDFQLKRMTYTTETCYFAQNRDCDEEEDFSGRFDIEHDNWWCFNIAVAIIESDKIHLVITLRCQTVASTHFNEEIFIRIRNMLCFIALPNVAHMTLNVVLIHDEDSETDYDGFPIMVPCSPGGYAVDPYTGRFVINEMCYRFFQDYTSEDVKGLDFIINKVYHSEENYQFPTKVKRPYDVKPIYFGRNNQPLPSIRMQPSRRLNTFKGNKTRSGCNYEKETTKVSEYLPCENLLSPDNLREEPSSDEINYYIHRNGCFLCSITNCDFNTPECEKISVIKKLPLYNNMLEFGLPATHLPKSMTVNITINENCYYHLKLQHVSKNVTLEVFECTSEFNNCTKRYASGLSYIIDFNNYFCIQYAIGFGSRNRLHSGRSNFCNHFASTEFHSRSLTIVMHKSCKFYRKNYKLVADFEFSQDNSSTHMGIPVIFPCSPGGLIVDPKTGRFVTGENCRNLFWESGERLDALSLTLESFHDNNENLLFKTEAESDFPYPYPIYYKSDHKFMSLEEASPQIVPNSEAGDQFRNGCYYRGKSTDVDSDSGTTTSTKTITIATTKTTSSTRTSTVITTTSMRSDTVISRASSIIRSQNNVLPLSFFLVNLKINI